MLVVVGRMQSTACCRVICKVSTSGLSTQTHRYSGIQQDLSFHGGGADKRSDFARAVVDECSVAGDLGGKASPAHCSRSALSEIAPAQKQECLQSDPALLRLHIGEAGLASPTAPQNNMLGSRQSQARFRPALHRRTTRCREGAPAEGTHGS